MTKLVTFFTFIIFTCLIICCNQYKYWDISKFKLDSTALSDNEEIKLLYTSRGPGNNEDRDYYIQVIAISQKSGDTVNILTTAENGFTLNDKDKVYNYFDQNNIAFKIGQGNLEKLNINDINKTAIKKITKVARDPKFDFIADNNFPTVIGVIGIFTLPAGN